MVSKMKAVLAGVFVLGLVIFGAQSDARAQSVLSAEMQAEISSLIADAVAENDATILEDGIFAVAGDNTELASQIAGFAADNLPDGLSDDFAGELAGSIARGATLAAPDQSGEIQDSLEASLAQFAAIFAEAIEEALAEADIETAAGAGDTGGGGAGGRGQGTNSPNAANESQNGSTPIGGGTPPASPDGEGGDA